MPELPEVETVRRGLNRVTLNYPIRGGQVLLDRTIAYPSSADDFLAGLKGARLTEWRRRGKYLLGKLSLEKQSAGWLGVHLRMTGQLLWLRQDESLQTHCRVRLFFEPDRELRFVDQRTFGRMWWAPPGKPLELIIPGLLKLGPEPFKADFSVNYLAGALKNRHRPIKNALLDQTLVAGIGNIYADEALFLSGIRPKTLCARLGPRRIKRLHEAIRQVLTIGIESGGTTFSDFRDIQGINGNYGKVAWVYDRAKEPCRVCGTLIQRLKLAGRSAHYCPKCQR
ncbi:MAG: DNA-formamidopyrimidine glycosylase [Pseudanabaenales cyanobacterium]|nr:DNA-formamidopyrimidine glycosylase [Pseudanabaenales cyanobacterium]